ncbi:MAG: hypothetical protein ACOYWZ_21660 [Bacillota bacterium]
MAKKQLKVVIQKNINNYLFSAVLLCIILAYDNLKPWFYENYIQLYFVRNKRGRYEKSEKWLDFYGALTAPQEVLEYNKLNKEFFMNIDIMKFIESCIDDGYYFYTYYDEYYVKPNFMKANIHFVHDLLIYGYDSENRKITAVGYNDNKIFCSYEIDYEAFEIAFKNGLELTKDGGWEDISFYGLKLKSRYDENYKYKFDISKFMSNFHDYVYSVNTGKRDYPEDKSYDSKELYYLHTLKDNVYGIDIYDHIIEYLKKTAEERTPLLYVMFHTLYEHKVSIMERLQYVADEFRIDGMADIVSNYKQTIGSLDLVRHLALKYNKVKKESVLSEMVTALEPEKNREKELLTKAYDIISRQCEFGRCQYESVY